MKRAISAAMSARTWAPPILASGLFLVSCATSGPAGPAPTIAYLSGDGVYPVETYTDFPDVPEFADATIYFPASATDLVGGVVISPGFTERQRHIAWWGPRLASHGFAVLIFDTNDPRDRPTARAEGLMAGVRLLHAENRRPGSPLRSRIDEGKMAVMGHSMGGGGALIASAEHGDEIAASIPFTPYTLEGRFDEIAVPTLIIAGSEDRITDSDEQAWPAFLNIPASTPKVYMEIQGGDHYIADSTRGEDLALIGRYAIAWLRLHLDGDARYGRFLYGDEAAPDRAEFSRYVTSP